ncbi:autophagy-related protein [Anaeramoeba ignava]|uniref:Autophagy-related protein n=1 Tax=Anaeramoeba ignava TaxID=1746090 RepID=A0A9Q0LVK6_ANAIG|nr:autophagy-related protein [Anaeramoeba ignava]
MSNSNSTSKIHVVVRVPWKRPIRIEPITEKTIEQEKQEKIDQKLLQFFSTKSLNENIDWDELSEFTGIPVEECIQRSKNLFQKHLEFFDKSIQQQKSNLQENKTKNENIKNYDLNDFKRNNQLQNQLKNSNEIGIEKFSEIVQKYKFDWMAISDVLKKEYFVELNPIECRTKYFQQVNDLSQILSNSSTLKSLNQNQIVLNSKIENLKEMNLKNAFPDSSLTQSALEEAFLDLNEK